MIHSTTSASSSAASTPRIPIEFTRELPRATSPELDRTGNAGKNDVDAMRDAFGDFVGQTLFGSMLATMRESVGKAAYFDGGRAEEVFQQQLDQKLVEEISNASAKSFVDPMFELFQLQRHG